VKVAFLFIALRVIGFPRVQAEVRHNRICHLSISNCHFLWTKLKEQWFKTAGGFRHDTNCCRRAKLQMTIDRWEMINSFVVNRCAMHDFVRILSEIVFHFRLHLLSQIHLTKTNSC